MKKIAFTLAEVLITLGIIGVVAAMTMPVLIQNQREKVVVTQLKKVQSVFSQAFLMAVEVNGMAEDWDIGTEDSSAGAQKLYNIMKPYLLKVEDCNLKKGCFYEGTYKSLNGPSYAWQPSVHSVYARGILADGTAFLFWSAGSGCELDASKDGKGPLSRVCGTIFVDVNGHRKPNRAGVDYFEFLITKNGIYPAGLPGSKSKYGTQCKYNDISNTNGASCTGWVITNGNMDYLKRDISSEWN